MHPCMPTGSVYSCVAGACRGQRKAAGGEGGPGRGQWCVRPKPWLLLHLPVCRCGCHNLSIVAAVCLDECIYVHVSFRGCVPTCMCVSQDVHDTTLCHNTKHSQPVLSAPVAPVLHTSTNCHHTSASPLLSGRPKRHSTCWCVHQCTS